MTAAKSEIPQFFFLILMKNGCLLTKSYELLQISKKVIVYDSNTRQLALSRVLFFGTESSKLHLP